jgi:hypothetical protein
MSLTDHFLTLIIAGCAVIGILVAFIIYYLQKGKKNLSYRVLYVVNLLSRDEELKGRVKILFDGNEVTNIQLLTLRLFNGGNTSIVKSDFEGPMKVEFNGNVRILSSELIQAVPENLEVAFDASAQNIMIYPLLLNGNDSMTFKLIIEGKFESLRILGRIRDIRAIKNLEIKNSFIQFYIAIALSALLIVSLVASLFATGKNGQRLLNFTESIGVILILSILITCIGVLTFRGKKGKGDNW